MKKLLQLFVLLGILVACNAPAKEEKKDIPVLQQNLTEVKDGVYTEWYEGKKQIKFRGGQDENQKRHGKWTYYSEAGVELSITFYDHGLRNGHTIVKYPSGALHYRGEYLNDTVVGVWTTYDEKGKLISEQDYTKK